MAPRQRISSNQSLVNMTLTTMPQQQAQPLLESSTQKTKPKFSSSRSNSNVSLEKEADDSAREAHDFFNLVALLVVVASTVVDWDLTQLPTGGPTKAYLGQFFWWNWATTVLYFGTDLLWVASVPHCVKSPGMIIKHHIVAIAYLSAPVLWPEYRWFMGACLSVEINTWFLIARRVVLKRKEELPNWMPFVVSQANYISWIIIRCFIYPAILVQFLLMASEAIQETKQFFHWPMIFIPVHFFLCLLNLKWTYDLFAPMIIQCLRRDKQNGGTIKVASGL